MVRGVLEHPDAVDEIEVCGRKRRREDVGLRDQRVRESPTLACAASTEALIEADQLRGMRRDDVHEGARAAARVEYAPARELLGRARSARSDRGRS